MSDTSDTTAKLRQFGAQKISEDTHIPLGHVESLLNEDFEKFTRIQFLGFISILEREYHIDLSELKERGLAFFKEHEVEKEISDASLFVAPTKSKNFTVVYIILAIIIFLIALYYTFGVTKEADESIHEVDNSAIEKAVQTIQKPSVIAEVNVTKSELNVTKSEANVTATQAKPIGIKKDKAVAYSIAIKPRIKVWLGYVDVATNKKYQRTFKDTLELDPKKEWILLFGHGYIDVDLNGETIKFSKKGTLRLWYKNGKLKEISEDEFKRLNKGRRW